MIYRIFRSLSNVPALGFPRPRSVEFTRMTQPSKPSKPSSLIPKWEFIVNLALTL